MFHYGYGFTSDLGITVVANPYYLWYYIKQTMLQRKERMLLNFHFFVTGIFINFLHIDQAVAEDPDDAVQWHQLGLHSLCSQQFKTAQKYLKAAVARSKECSYAWSNLGISQIMNIVWYLVIHILMFSHSISILISSFWWYICMTRHLSPVIWWAITGRRCIQESFGIGNTWPSTCDIFQPWKSIPAAETIRMCQGNVHKVTWTAAWLCSCI